MRRAVFLMPSDLEASSHYLRVIFSAGGEFPEYCFSNRCHLTHRKFEIINTRMTILETVLDFQALAIKLVAWCGGLYRKGISGAHKAASGLNY